MRVWKFYSGMIKSIEERLTDRKNDQSFGDAIQSKLEKEGYRFQQDKIDEELDKLIKDESINNVYDNDLVDNSSMNKDFSPEVQRFSSMDPQTEQGFIPSEQNNLFDSDVMLIGADYDRNRNTSIGYYKAPNYPEFQKGLPNQVTEKDAKDFEEQAFEENYEWTEYHSADDEFNESFSDSNGFSENVQTQKNYSDLPGDISTDAGTKTKSVKNKENLDTSYIDPNDLFPSPFFSDNYRYNAIDRLKNINGFEDEYESDLEKIREDFRQMTLKDHIDNILSSENYIPFNSDAYKSLPDDDSELDEQQTNDSLLEDDSYIEQGINENQVSIDECIETLPSDENNESEVFKDTSSFSEDVDSLDSDDDFLKPDEIDETDLRTTEQILSDMKNDDNINNIHDVDAWNDDEYGEVLEEKEKGNYFQSELAPQEVDGIIEQDSNSTSKRNNLYDTDFVNLDDDQEIDYDKENYDPGFSEISYTDENGLEHETDTQGNDHVVSQEAEKSDETQKNEEYDEDDEFDDELDDDSSEFDNKETKEQENSNNTENEHENLPSTTQDDLINSDNVDSDSKTKESNGLKGLPFPIGHSESIMDTDSNKNLDSGEKTSAQGEQNLESSGEIQDFDEDDVNSSDSQSNSDPGKSNVDNQKNISKKDRESKKKDKKNKRVNDGDNEEENESLDNTIDDNSSRDKEEGKSNSLNQSGESSDAENTEDSSLDDDYEKTFNEEKTLNKKQKKKNKKNKKQDKSSDEKINSEDSSGENDDELTEEEKKSLKDILDDKSKLDNRKKMQLLNKSKKFLNKKMKQEHISKQKKKVELSEEEKKRRVENFKNNFTGMFDEVPSFEQRNRGDGYSIDTVTLEEVPNSVIKTLIDKFLTQQFCKKDTDLNVRSNNLEETSGFHKWKIKDVIVHLETEQVTKVLTDKIGYSYAEGEHENIPLSFYFDMSGSMSRYTAMLATVAIELIKKDVKVLIGFNERVHVQIDEIEKDIDVSELAQVLENAGGNYYSYSDVNHKKVKYKDINDDIDSYLISSKAEKCVVFSDFDPKDEVINLSQKAQTYWFCFESNFSRQNLGEYQGFIYQVQNINDIAHGLIKVGNKRFETLCFTENPTGIGRRRSKR